VLAEDGGVYYWHAALALVSSALPAACAVDKLPTVTLT
jgi:hypothetical protein